MTGPALRISFGYAFIADSGREEIQTKTHPRDTSTPMRRYEVLALVSFMDRSVPLKYRGSIKTVRLKVSCQKSKVPGNKVYLQTTSLDLRDVCCTHTWFDDVVVKRFSLEDSRWNGSRGRKALESPGNEI
ncbi:hypothetical protein KQX54_011768 [Cotesia glomerata]|uniref:Uncharacterized protein n=1 Tax=Cotesia glomerata TaxID=32391 RepID=A0AAV7J0T9_COTGL|nr:hypothetical protein KQX54_011768 [Cotesia glomerata]